MPLTRQPCAPLLAALVGAALGACAAASPGYTPETGKKSLFDKAKPFDGGEVANDGRYAVSAAERQLDCKRLRGSMLVIIAKLKSGNKSAAPSALSATIQSGVATVQGRRPMLEPTVEGRRERARLDAYNGLLAEKKCPTIDLAAALAPTKGP